jgi:hypothetical protein
MRSVGLGPRPSPFVVAVAAAPVVLALSRLLPDDGVGLAVRLAAAGACVLLVPGALIVRGLRVPLAGSVAVAAAVALSLAVVFLAFALTFALEGSLRLTLALVALAAVISLLPRLVRGAIDPTLERAQPVDSRRARRRARRAPDDAEARDPAERLAVLSAVAAGVVFAGLVWWVSHSLGTGDVLFHLARARRLAEVETLTSVGVVNEFRDGGLHPGYAFPLWHGVLALVARLAGVDVTAVVLHFASVLVPIAFVVTYAAGRALFASWVGGVAVLAAQVAHLGFSRPDAGSYGGLALPSALSRALLVPLLLALLFAYLRSPSRTALVSLAASALALAVIHPTYVVHIGVPLAGFALVAVAFATGRRSEGRRLAAAAAAVVVPSGLFFAWLFPVIADTASYRPAETEEARALTHYGAQLQAVGDAYRVAPDVITRGGPVVVAGLACLPLVALAARRRWGALAVGGTLAGLAVLLVPELFTRFSDLVSISQSRRLAQFLPLAFAVAAAAVVVGRLRLGGVALALAAGLALELAYDPEFSHVVERPGPTWPLWVAIVGGILGLAAAAALNARLDRWLAPTRWGALAAVAFALPIGVAGLADVERRDAPDPRGLTPGAVEALAGLGPEAVVFAQPETSYRVGAFTPVYVVASLPHHVADTEANRPYRRQRDAIRFFNPRLLDARERDAMLARYGADWLLVDKARPYPREFVASLQHVYEDGRYLLARVATA